ncbi:MAG TPA: UdgX family uracil-DNA binding protein [Candidatus Acidoferrum sp.]|nr:UdgX family uracil-DNA binding protein [Candidatus Acidoferrum sp.]
MPPRSKKPALLPRATGSLQELAQESKKCRNCDLWRNATQTVFGEGPAGAPIMLIGEVPGDQEDQQGKPFVGPAGTLLRAILNEAGIDLNQVYLTNVVKHFKWEPRGKRRIHKTPNASEIKACRSWLDAEIAALKPKVIVCLGATAAQALLGRGFRVTQHRGELIDSDLAPRVMATVHPSAILRAPDENSRRQQEREFLADLKKVAAMKLQ